MWSTWSFWVALTSYVRQNQVLYVSYQLRNWSYFLLKKKPEHSWNTLRFFQLNSSDWMLKIDRNKIGFDGKVHERFHVDFLKLHDIAWASGQILFRSWLHCLCMTWAHDFSFLLCKLGIILPLKFIVMIKS